MSLCLVALVVFAFLSIFSAKYRPWAREAFGCVGRMVTFRPCTTTFKQKARAKVTSAIMKRHLGLAKFTHKHFEAISWVFTIIFFLSLAYTVYGLGNLVIYGTCDPVSGDCIFNPMDPHQVTCPFESLDLSGAVLTIGGFGKVPDAQGEPLVYLFGTTWCPHCAWERPIYQRTVAKFGDSIDAHLIEIDLEPNSPHIPVFSHYSAEGKIPIVVIGGKYFRVGVVEKLGDVTEEAILTALICDVAGSPIDECESPEIQTLMNQI